MSSERVWHWKYLKSIWLIQILCGIGAAVNTLPFAQLASDLTWTLFIPSPDTYVYLFITVIEIVLYVYARLPPPLYTLTNTSKLIAGVSALSRVLWRRTFVARPDVLIWPKVAIDVVLFYHHQGIAYGVCVWQQVHCKISRPGIGQHSAQRKQDTAHQFDHVDTQWLIPLRVAEWASTGTFLDDRRWFVRAVATLLQPLKWAAGALTTQFTLAIWSVVRGEADGLVGTSNVDSAEARLILSNYPKVSIRTMELAYGDLPDVDPGEVENVPLTGFRPRDSESTYISSRMRTVYESRQPDTARLEHREHADSDRRRLRPRHLCILDRKSKTGYKVVSVDDDAALYEVPYVFISYTRVQFCTDLSGNPNISLDQHSETPTTRADRDMAALISIAKVAARKAGTEAFWIDFECVKSDTPGNTDASKSMQDVFYICDAVRSSKCIAIVVNSPLDDDMEHVVTDHSVDAQRRWLLGYGERLWTLPEALLCPSNFGVLLWQPTHDKPSFKKIEKRNLASFIWTDASVVGPLIAHYEGSVRLNEPQLMSIALECLRRRQTNPRTPADMIYALMGLMHTRLEVRPDDTAFQAFARLALANNSDRPLERLFCMRPRSHTAPWHELDDTWHAKLWDITPECQIAEVCSGDAVMLGDVYGAMIDWQPLAPIDFIMAPRPFDQYWKICRKAATRSVSLFMLVAAEVYLFTLVLILNALDSWERVNKPIIPTKISIACFVIPMCMNCVLWVFTLPVVLRFYDGEVDRVQARFYGVVGLADLSTVDRMLFGKCRNRFTWSSDNHIDRADDDFDTDRQLYTLIDTWSMTATVFRASNQPTVLMACGKHKGLLRVILCSFDISTATLFRETVLQMETSVLQRMSRMDRCRVSFSPRPRYQDGET